MCGRYYFDIDDKELKEIADSLLMPSFLKQVLGLAV